jgi:hypothetical protein
LQSAATRSPRRSRWRLPRQRSMDNVRSELRKAEVENFKCGVSWPEFTVLAARLDLLAVVFRVRHLEWVMITPEPYSSSQHHWVSL